MTVKFICQGEIVGVLKNHHGPEPQVGDKIYLEEDESYDVHEVIRRSINLTKSDVLTCYIDCIQ